MPPDAAVLIAPQPWRTGLAMVAFAALFALIAWRLHHLQVDQGGHLAELGERQRTRTWTIQAARGNLYDADGAPLAVSDGTWTVTCDPIYMDDRLRATVELNRILGIPRSELRAHFESPRNGRTLAKSLDDAHAEEIRRLNLAGVYVRREFTRRFPEGALAAHTLGFVFADGKGASGIEQALDQEMAGIPGHETVTVDALGKPSLTDAESQPAQPGAHVQLTISMPIQRILETALLEQVGACRPLSAAGVVIRPATGEILAMASWPTFDPARITARDQAAMRNNLLTFPYEPGSTMKPLVVGAAVSDGLTSFSEMINCERGAWTYREGRAVRTIHEKTGGHGILSVVQGISLSDNILMAKLGVRMTPEQMKGWMQRLGFGQRTGITLRGEDSGLLPRGSGGKWSRLNENMSLSIGHGIMVTPLQLALAHAAVANGGLWLPPRLIKRVYAAGDQERELPTPALPEPRRIFSPEVAAGIQEAMTHTMTDGTAQDSELVGYTAAGKTGTAEKVVGGGYSSAHNIGSFVCWAPAEPNVRPELLCLVVVDDPSVGKGFGSIVAAPVVQKVLQASLEYLHVPKRPDLVQAEETKGKPGATATAARKPRR
jgi:cell division protein FtsI (penicillin-binding protein 3)